MTSSTDATLKVFPPAPKISFQSEYAELASINFPVIAYISACFLRCNALFQAADFAASVAIFRIASGSFKRKVIPPRLAFPWPVSWRSCATDSRAVRSSATVQVPVFTKPIPTRSEFGSCSADDTDIRSSLSPFSKCHSLENLGGGSLVWVFVSTPAAAIINAHSMNFI